MALTDIDPRSLATLEAFQPSADPTASILQALTGSIQQGRADAATRDQNQLFAQGAQQAFAGTQTPQQEAALFAANSERAIKLLEAAGASTERGRTKLAQTAFKIQQLNPEQREAALLEVGQKVTAGGGDGSIWLNQRGKSPQEQNQFLQNVQNATLSVSDRAAQDLSEREFGLKEEGLDLQRQRLSSDQQLTQARIAEINRPKAPASTTIEKQLIAAGIPRGSDRFKQEILKHINKPSGTNITIGDTNTLAKATEGQLASAGFANRMANSAFELNALEDGGFNPGDLQQKIGTTVPGGNVLLSEEGQLYQAAKIDFITAVLRKESGAVIGQDEEAREDKKFFPQVGDGPKTIAAKRRRRARAIDNLIKQSKGVYGIQFEAPGTQVTAEGAANSLTDAQIIKDLGL